MGVPAGTTVCTISIYCLQKRVRNPIGNFKSAPAILVSRKMQVFIFLFSDLPRTRVAIIALRFPQENIDIFLRLKA